MYVSVIGHISEGCVTDTFMSLHDCNLPVDIRVTLEMRENQHLTVKATSHF